MFTSAPARKLILEWIDRELSVFLQEYGFTRQGASFSKPVANGTAVVEIVGWPASTGRRATISLLSGIASTRLTSPDQARALAAFGRPANWYSTQIWWSAGAGAWNRGGRRWWLDTADSDGQASTGQAMREWLNRLGWRLIDRFADDREILGVFLEDDTGQALATRELAWTRILLKEYGPSPYIAKLDALIEAEHSRGLSSWSTGMRDAERMRSGNPGLRVTTITGEEIGLGNPDEEAIDALMALGDPIFPGFHYAGPGTELPKPRSLRPRDEPPLSRPADR